MRSINKVILIGNLTRDPEIRQTPNGQNVTTFGIATNREWITRDNKKHSLAEYHDLVAWAKLAEICAKHLKKGKLVYIEGYLKTRSWDAPEGVKKFKTEIVVQDMIMLDKRSQGETTSEDYIPEEENGMSLSTPDINDELDLGTKLSKKPAVSERSEPKPERTFSAPVEKESEPVGVSQASNTPSPQSLSIDDDLGL